MNSIIVSETYTAPRVPNHVPQTQLASAQTSNFQSLPSPPTPNLRTLLLYSSGSSPIGLSLFLRHAEGWRDVDHRPVSLLSSVARLLCTGVPKTQQGPAKSCSEVGRLGQQARREAGELGELSSRSPRLGASLAEWSSAEQQKSIPRREASRGCPTSPAGLGAQGPTTTTTTPSSYLQLSFYFSPGESAPARARALTLQLP
ncbi:hypothetical protein GOODEAATRI_004927 [Goodea atripinnis]|uniref:Uncharacterized protein n=1 Tax=Goodea atripinnis TaxID=208336 RepID=A0ABV0PKX9_9TELE